MVQPLWRTVWRVLNRLQVESAHGPTLIPKDTCTPMFTAALFTIVKAWKQLKCPSVDELIQMWYIREKRQSLQQVVLGKLDSCM